MKFINGTWFEFQHHNKPEGKYYNPQSKEFTDEQWRTKIGEIHDAGMEYIVLLASALDYAAYFPTDVLPPADLKCKNPMDVLMSETEKLGMKVFVSTGFYGDWTRPDINTTDKEIMKREKTAMGQLYEQFGKYKSFYGWYFPDEAYLGNYFREGFIDYLNDYDSYAKSFDSTKKTLIAPYGTRVVKCDDVYAKQLEELNVDIVAYQDEVGVQKTKVEELPEIFERIRKVHDKVGKSKMWADMELFEFEGVPYKSALLPPKFERIRQQIEAISPYVDEILTFDYQSAMNKPGTTAFAGVKESENLYADYVNWKDSFK